MKGDFSRFTFEPRDDVRAVLIQQGRPLDDASLNEGCEATLRRVETETVDVVGTTGAPLKGGGFQIIKQSPQANAPFLITEGRFYVEGLQLQNHQTCSVISQPMPIPAPAGAGRRLVYVRALVDHQTGVDMPRLLDPALGDADTTTRSVIRWQVRMIMAGAQDLCGSANAIWDAMTAAPATTMTATVDPGVQSTDPCKLTAGGGYARPENLLYRVEAHDGSPPNPNPNPPEDGFRFIREGLKVKVSRNNGMEVAHIKVVNGNDLTVDVGSRDGMPVFRVGEYLEILDEADGTDVGTAVGWTQINAVNGDVVTVASAAGAQAGRRIRQWSIDLVTLNNANGYSVSLDGLKFAFAGDGYRRGTYWMVPARYVTADVLSPVAKGVSMPPHGPRVVYAKLGLVDLDANGIAQGTPIDCRPVFEPLTELMGFHYAGGDGQTVSPVGIAPGNLAPVASLLRAGVRIGRFPLPGARVKFELVPTTAAGQLQRQGGGPGPAQGTSVVVETDADGLAAVAWSLNLNDPVQRVRASLVDLNNQAGTLPPPIEYSASLGWAKVVGYAPGQCADLMQVTNVQDALDVLCKRPAGGAGCAITVGAGGQYPGLEEALKATLRDGRRQVCLCLLAGDHELGSLQVSGAKLPDLVLKISGCGPQSRIILRKPIIAQRIRSFTLSRVAVEVGFQVNAGQGAVSFERCEDLTVEDCYLGGVVELGALLLAEGVQRVQLRGNRFVAMTKAGPQRFISLFKKAQLDVIAGLLAITDRVRFEAAVPKVTQQIVDSTFDERKRMDRTLASAMGDPTFAAEVSAIELSVVTRFRALLVQERPDPLDLAALLSDFVMVGARILPAVAVVLRPSPPGGTDGEDLQILENNEIVGNVCLGGFPGATRLTKSEKDDLLNALKRTSIRVTCMPGTVELRSNQLSGIAVAEDMIQSVRQLLQAGKGELTGTYRRAILNDNILQRADSEVIAAHLTLMSNDLSLAAWQKGPPVIVTAIADSAILVGNHGREIQDEFIVLSRLRQAVANAEMTLTP